LLKQGHKMQAPDAKCNTVSARTMETFRRPHGIPQEELYVGHHVGGRHILNASFLQFGANAS